MKAPAFSLQISSLEIDTEKGIHSSSGALIVDGYRYRLWRAWARGPRLTWLMLNPSTADAAVNDATIRRCIGFARAWGYSGIEVLNLFAYRATNPAELLRVKDPVGPDNDRHLAEVIGGSAEPRVIAAWGAHGSLNGRALQVRQMLRRWCVPVMCLGLTKDGHPKHPLRLPADLQPMRWEAA